MVRAHHKLSKVLLKCRNCSYECRTSGNLKSHEKIHTNEYPFNCEFCPKVFRHSCALKTHTRVHTGEKPFKCSLCLKTFRQSGHIDSHMRSHTNEKPYKCKQCYYAARTPDILRKHMWVHTDDRPFKCQLCPFSTARKHRLESHEQRHQGEKPFKCKLCNFAAFTEYYSSMHLKSHRQEKTSGHQEESKEIKNLHQCPFCPKNLTTATHLRTHLRSHTGERPFACKKCPYTASNSRSVVLHERRHENGHLQGRSQSCSFCNRPFRFSKTLETHLLTCEFKLKNERFVERSVGVQRLQLKRMWSCKACGEHFDENITLARHYSLLHKLPAVRITCLDSAM